MLLAIQQRLVPLVHRLRPLDGRPGRLDRQLVQCAPQLLRLVLGRQDVRTVLGLLLAHLLHLVVQLTHLLLELLHLLLHLLHDRLLLLRLGRRSVHVLLQPPLHVLQLLLCLLLLGPESHLQILGVLVRLHLQLALQEVLVHNRITQLPLHFSQLAVQTHVHLLALFKFTAFGG